MKRGRVPVQFRPEERRRREELDALLADQRRDRLDERGRRVDRRPPKFRTRRRRP